MSPRTISFDQLATAPLLIDAVYEGGQAGNAGDDPIGKLLPVGNQGGFRYKGSPRFGTVSCVVLYTSGDDLDWPDELNPATGDFTYYGDNKKPGHELHDTRRRGNWLLRSIFEAARESAEARLQVPPILLFQKAGRGRDVIFRGLLAPGSPRLRVDEELVAVWRTTANLRFQNYRAHFTVLKTPAISRAWIDEILQGNPLGPHCPLEWRSWVTGRIYQPLEAPRNILVRSKASQLPDPGDAWMIDSIHRYFKQAPDRFENMAADVWLWSEPRAVAVEVTRPSRDGGRDGLGQLLLGPAEDPIKLEFALEAKCYALTTTVGVKEVSRLISRIKHREFGVFVTTSSVGEQAYSEVREDGHPVVFLTGSDIVSILKQRGIATPERLAELLEGRYPLASQGLVDSPMSRADFVEPPVEAGIADVLGDRGRTGRAGRSRTFQGPGGR